MAPATRADERGGRAGWIVVVVADLKEAVVKVWKPDT
jgi:hypothetical protein